MRRGFSGRAKEAKAMSDVRVIYCDLPPRIHGLTVGCEEDGQMYYTSVLNSCLSFEMNRCTYFHEAAHIINGDFTHIYSVDELEELRHSA